MLIYFLWIFIFNQQNICPSDFANIRQNIPLLNHLRVTGLPKSLCVNPVNCLWAMEKNWEASQLGVFLKSKICSTLPLGYILSCISFCLYALNQSSKLKSLIFMVITEKYFHRETVNQLTFYSLSFYKIFFLSLV